MKRGEKGFLRRSLKEKAFELIFEHSGEIVLVMNGEGEVVEGNEKALSVLGPSLVGEKIEEIFEGARFPEDYRESVHVVRSLAVHGRSREGRRRAFAITPFPMGDEGTLIIGRDIERYESFKDEIEKLRKRVRALEQERRRDEKNMKLTEGSREHALKELEGTNQRLEEYNKRLMRELDLAAVLQQSLVPRQLPPSGRIRFAFRYLPMGKIGGDYYDVVDLEDERKGVIVADVSGHGVSAAFISAMIKIFFVNFAPGCVSPSELLAKLNREYCNIIQTGEYVTAFYAVFDPKRKEVIYCGAGHPTSLLHRKKTKRVEPLPSDGFFIGMYGESDYTSTAVHFEPGDRCLFYTDGIVEAYSERKGEQFGGDRLFRSFQVHAAEPLETMVEAMVEDVRRFMGKSTFLDDLAMVALEFADESEHDKKGS